MVGLTFRLRSRLRFRLRFGLTFRLRFRLRFGLTFRLRFMAIVARANVRMLLTRDKTYQSTEGRAFTCNLDNMKWMFTTWRHDMYVYHVCAGIRRVRDWCLCVVMCKRMPEEKLRRYLHVLCVLQG